MTDSAVCDPGAGQPPTTGPRLATVRLTARGEEFRIVQLQGQLLVCARQYGSCCCGCEEKGRMPFDPQALWGDEWERRLKAGRVIAFCAPSCRKQFLADPSAYLTA